MRVKERIIDSERYSSILFNIASGINYNEILSKELKTEPNALIQHLKRLSHEYFIFGKKGGRFNRKFYSINWNKIKEELFIYIKSIDKDVEIKKDYYDNKYLDLFLKEIFNEFKKENVTIKIFFKALVGSACNIFYSSINDKDWKEFEEIMDIIGNTKPEYSTLVYELTQNKIEKEIYRELIKNHPEQQKFYKYIKK